MKFLHCSGFYLDSPFDNFPPGYAGLIKRRDALMRAFLLAMDQAAANQVDLILIAGNLFENHYVSHKTICAIAEKFNALGNIRIFIAPGDRDCADETSCYRHFPWPDNVHIFLNPSLEYVDLPELNTTIYGAGVVTTSEHAPILTGFGVENPEAFNILLLHAWDMSRGQEDMPSGFPVKSKLLPPMGIKYAALGYEMHYRELYDEKGDICGCYPGTPEWLGHGTHEKRRIMMVLADGEKPVLRPIFTSPRKCLDLELESSTLDRNAILHFLDASEASDQDLLKLTLKGERSVMTIPETLELQEELEQKYYYFQYQDRTRIFLPPQDTLTPLDEKFLRRLMERLPEAAGGRDRHDFSALTAGLELLKSTGKL